MDIWFQDEAHIGQKTSTTHVWAEKGSRPRAVKQQFEYAYIFGAVCPAKGETEALIVPWVNKEIIAHHLKRIAKRTQSGRYAVVIMDGAGRHTDDIAEDIDNLSILNSLPTPQI